MKARAQRMRQRLSAVLVPTLVAGLALAAPAAAMITHFPTPRGPLYHHAETSPTSYDWNHMTAKERNGRIVHWGSLRSHGRATYCGARCNPTRTGKAPTAAAATGKATGGFSNNIWCNWFSGEVWTNNITRSTIWTYTERVDYCYDATNELLVSHMTTTHSNVHLWASADGWEFKGDTDGTPKVWDPYQNGRGIRSYAQGHFDWCPPRIWCVASKYPYLYVDVYADGTGSLSMWGV